MEEKEMIDFLKERLRDNHVSSKIEKKDIPVLAKDMCVVLKKRLVVCQVKDEARAMFSLWRYATNELPILFISTKRNTSSLLKDMFAEVFGFRLEDLDISASAAFKGLGTFIDDFSNAKIYINDSAKSLDEKCIFDLIMSYDINVVVTDS